MKTCIIFLIIIIIIIGLILTYLFLSKKTQQKVVRFDMTKNTIHKFSAEERYNGIILFDIDGTLSSNSRESNSNSVQLCLDNGYEVGIATAGPGYTVHNIKNMHWMPKNLYNAMEKNNFITFNNVGSNILMGKNTHEYSLLNINNKYKWGFYKALAMERILRFYSEKDKIKAGSQIVLFDNDENYIEGVRKFPSKNIAAICAGFPCRKNRKCLESEVKKYFLR